MATKYATVSALAVATVLLVLPSRDAAAEFCWDYVDGKIEGFEETQLPFYCIEEGVPPVPAPTSDSCSCSGVQSSCTQACQSIPAPERTWDHRVMHAAWHDCFGAVGGEAPSVGRSARWLGFHRQYEFDFDLARSARATCNPAAGEGNGCFIEALDWHPGMNLPYGHFGQVNPPSICGQGPTRPDDLFCETCIALPQCMYWDENPRFDGTAFTPAEGCSGYIRNAGGELEYAGTSAPNQLQSLADFNSVEEIAIVLDRTLHGSLHGNIGTPYALACGSDEDCVDYIESLNPGKFVGEPVCVKRLPADPTGVCQYDQDVNASQCSPRDGMFWRLHKALDDSVRAWQERQPVEVMVVLDRSGSMNQADSSGDTKMDVAFRALEMFTDMLNESQVPGHRIGVVSYGSSASDEVSLQSVADAFDDISALDGSITPSGCTGIGSGLNQAIESLCPGPVDPINGDPTCEPEENPGLPTDRRRAIVLLTDGLENREPCLHSVSATELSCGEQCGGRPLDLQNLGPWTELCAVGFGDEGTLNSNLLTLLAERQGGIYMQTPSLGPDAGLGEQWVDLKDFFVKCLGTLTDSELGIDPKGVLGTNAFHTEVSVQTVCDDEKLTFAGGWDSDDALYLMVNAPSGDLVQRGGSVTGAHRDTYDFVVVPLPYQGEQAGEWSSQLIRPHFSYVNGFTTDALDSNVSVPLVRREIQRLCPTGCDDVLYYEDGQLGPESSYELALAAELEAGLLEGVTTALTPEEFQGLLESESWDVVVYAHQLTQDVAEPYDDALVDSLCSLGQRAIVTDTRQGFWQGESYYSAPEDINFCAGAYLSSSAENYGTVYGDGRLLQGNHDLTNHGYARFSYDFGSAFYVGPTDIQAISGFEGGAIVARGEFVGEGPWQAERWFLNTLTRANGRLDNVAMAADLATSDDGLLASVRILPGNMPTGGFDSVTATVDVEQPVPGTGLGQTLIDIGPQSVSPSYTEDSYIGRGAALALAGVLPTTTDTYVLNDEGHSGDLHPGNAQWSAQVPTGGNVDGVYRFHFQVDMTVNGCTTHRELYRTKIVRVGVDPGSSVVTTSETDDEIETTLFPQDEEGNPTGWGIGDTITCTPEADCVCEANDVVDHYDGSYTVTIHKSAPDVRCGVAIGPDAPISVSGDPSCQPDVTPPALSATADLYLAACSAGAVVRLESPTATDNCSRSVEVEGELIESNGQPIDEHVHHHGMMLGQGTHVVRWTATDELGNVTERDLGVPGNDVTVTTNACLRVLDGYPSWWTPRPMKLETTAGGAYPIPYTWQNPCTGSGGSGTFTHEWEGQLLPGVSAACETITCSGHGWQSRTGPGVGGGSRARGGSGHGRGARHQRPRGGSSALGRGHYPS